MFENWRNTRTLIGGLNNAFLMAHYGVPEILIIHRQYEETTLRYIESVTQDIQSRGNEVPRLVVLLVDPENVCTDCTTSHVKALADYAFPTEGSLKAPIVYKYFGIEREYASEVTDKIEASL